MRKEIMNYEAPLIEVMDVEVEKGFAASVPSVGGDAIGAPSLPEGDQIFEELNQFYN